MSLRRVDLNLLTVFDAIYDEGNLTRAATRIGMSQPAMSNALNRVRDLVGDDLFVRDGRGIKPTARANELAPAVREALKLIETALELPLPFNPNEHHRFSVVGFDYCEVVVLPRLKRLLDRNYPQLDLRSITGTSTEMEEPLKFGEVDMIIDYVPIRKPGFIFESLFEEELVVLARNNHPAIGARLDLDTFLRQRFVFREDRSDEPRPEIDQILDRMGKARDIALSVTNWLAVPQLVADTDLICTCPKLFAEMNAERFSLVVHPVPLKIKRVPVHMIWHESRRNQASHRWLRAQVKRACRHIN